MGFVLIVIPALWLASVGHRTAFFFSINEKKQKSRLAAVWVKIRRPAFENNFKA